MTALGGDPFQLRQVQMLDGSLYLHAGDVVACLRAQAVRYGELADSGSVGASERLIYRTASQTLARYADQLDVAAIGCVTTNNDLINQPRKD
ncbi:hypothetical protein ACFFX1_55410 [Dactylosporangium sucinum]|uniref:Uncharacterized protein n=1 Tax=Dactylosporangium sucinum TaxID=1424081 RepID=A0A917U3E9_9ACTN|nr:hypothetical protein [Dactylosporangium sucinum]GGM52667.1 hypothetical protein GCM10007977_062820 [Dactylosporangium sucinum]